MSGHKMQLNIFETKSLANKSKLYLHYLSAMADWKTRPKYDSIHNNYKWQTV